jgi:hypothetical protein
VFSNIRCQQKFRWRAFQCITFARDCQRPAGPPGVAFATPDREGPSL